MPELMQDVVLAMYGENEYALNILNALVKSGKAPKAILIEKTGDLASEFFRETKLLFSALKKKGFSGFLRRLSYFFTGFLKAIGVEEKENTAKAFLTAKPFLKHYKRGLKLSDFKGLGIEIIEMKTNSDEFVSYLNSNKIKVVLVGTKIIQKKFLSSTKAVFFNGHPGYLPYFRGLDSVKWAFFHSYQPGATLHFIDQGIDTGKIIRRGLVDVKEDDSFASIRMKARDLCISFFLDSIEKVRTGKISPKTLPEQDLSKGFESKPLAYSELQSAKKNLAMVKHKISLGEKVIYKKYGE